jgi:hypothetical protein
VLSIISSIQQTLLKDSGMHSSELISLPLSMVEELLDSLTETLKIVEVVMVTNENPSAIKDRCFFCYNRIKQLKQLLQASLRG